MSTKLFVIDMIRNTFKTDNPLKITKLCKDLNVSVTPKQVLDYINKTENIELEISASKI